MESTINNNKAGDSGGGVYTSGRLLLQFDSNVDNNEAVKDGGGVYVNDGGYLEVSTNSFISDNTAGENGGGVYTHRTFNLMIYSNVSNNTAGENGGGVYTHGTFNLMFDSNVNNNEAGKDGGGVYVGDGGTFNFIDGNVSNNTADENGGGAYIVNDGKFKFDNGMFRDNKANGSGGAIYAENYSNLSVSVTALFENNSASQKIDLRLTQAQYLDLFPTILSPYALNYSVDTAYHPVNNYDINAQYTVIYKANDGTDAEFVQKIGTSGTFTTITFTDEFTALPHINFLGWNTQPDGKGIRYGESAIVSFNSSMILYAEWDARYIVTKAIDGGDVTHIGYFHWLQDAVNVTGDYSPLGESFTITATRNDNDVTNGDNRAVTIPADRHITITSDENGPYTIKQPNLARHVVMDSGDQGLSTILILKDIIFEGGNGPLLNDGTSGGIEVSGSGSNLIMEDGATIWNCYTDSDGGGIHISNEAQLTMENSTIHNNTALGDGGGVYIDEYSQLETYDSSIIDNKADGNGGGVYVGENGGFNLENSTVSNNIAKENGGGVYVSEAVESEIYNSSIIDNKADGNGGGVYAGKAVQFEIFNSSISDNKAGDSGGGVYGAEGVRFDMSDNSSISYNEAVENGGGVYTWAFGLSSDSNVGNNKAGKDGGGVYILGDASLHNRNCVLRDGSIHDNEAGGDGGGVYLIIKSGFIINNCTIIHNEAGGDGGGVFISSEYPYDGLFSSSYSSISYNVAGKNGGGVFFENSSYFTLGESNISDNTAQENGGGIYVIGIQDKTAISYHDSNIINNTALNGDGGGAYFGGDCLFTIENSKFSGNNASKGDGGAIFAEDPPALNISATTLFENNIAFKSIDLELTQAQYLLMFPDISSPYVQNYSVSTAYHPVNNYDINVPFTVTYKANDGTGAEFVQKIGTSGTFITLTFAETGFPDPEHMIFRGWDTKPDGTGTHYDVSETVTVPETRSMILYAVWDARYIVTKENHAGVVTHIGYFHWLQDAVDACGTFWFSDIHQEFYTITATRNDDDVTNETDIPVTIPADRHITITSDENGPYTIKQPNLARHIVMDSGDQELPTTLILKDIIFEGGNNPLLNSGTSGGIVVSGDNAQLHIEDATIWNCYTDSNGGGIHVSNEAQLDMENSTIHNNTALGSGGGVYSNSRGLEINGSDFSNNTALNGDGGGVYSVPHYSGSGNIYYSIFNDNIAGGNGGGLYAFSPDESYLISNAFDNNKAGVHGGGLYLDGDGAFDLGGSVTISNNKALGDGGGVYSVVGWLKADYGDFTISENEAGGHGGGVYVGNNSLFQAKNFTISDNEAGGNGGGVYLDEFTQFEMYDSTISGNEADGDGGGIYLHEFFQFVMDNSTISNNEADGNGGGVYSNDGFIKLTESTIYNNTAGDSGGGVYTSGTFFL